MKLHEHFNLKEKESRQVYDEIVNFWNQNLGEKTETTLIFILNKYKDKKLHYALTFFGYVIGGIEL